MYVAFVVDVYAQRIVAWHAATDVFHPRPFKSLADIEYATAGWVDWYNNRRLHGTLGMLTPAEYESAHYAALKTEEQPV